MWSNFKVEWKMWWRGSSWLARLAPLTVVAVHIAWRGLFGGPSVEDVFFAAGLLFTFYGLPSKRSPFSFWLPLYCGWLVHLVFISVPAGTYPHFTGREALEIDRRFLSFLWEEKSVTVPEFLNLWVKSGIVGLLQKILIAVPLVAVAYSAVLRFYYSNKGTASYSAWGIDTLAPQVNWAIVWAWAGSHFGFPSVHVAVMTIVAYYAFKFAALRTAAVAGLVVVTLVAMLAGRAQSVEVVFGIVEGLVICSIVDMVAYQRPKRQAQKIWNPSTLKKDPPPPRKKAV